MAINKNNSLSGMVGPVVVYELNGKQVMRARPRPHKKSKASQEAAKQFGLASALSKQIRLHLRNGLPGYADPKMRYRFEAVIRAWLRNGRAITDRGVNGFSLLDRFQFNEKSSLFEKLGVQLSIDWTQRGKIVVNIPALVPVRDIAAPPKTESVRWFIDAASSEWDNHVTLDITYNESITKARRCELDFPTSPGKLTIVLLTLEYTIKSGNNRQVTRDEKWLPAWIIGSFYKERK